MPLSFLRAVPLSSLSSPSHPRRAGLRAGATFAAAGVLAALSVAASAGPSSGSFGASSASSNASSDASSPGRPLRRGAYRIEQMAEAPGREGYVRLTLRPLQPEAETAPAVAAASPEAAAAANGAATALHLYLPRQTVQRAALASGHSITASERPFGLALSHGAQAGGEVFFIVMADEWHRELHARPVTL